MVLEENVTSEKHLGLGLIGVWVAGFRLRMRSSVSQDAADGLHSPTPFVGKLLPTAPGGERL